MGKADQYIIPRLGVLAVPIGAELAKSLDSEREPGGLVVIAKTFEASAQSIGLEVGDILHSVNQIKLDSPNPLDTLKNFMLGLKPGDPVVLQVERDSELNYLAFRFED